MMGVVLFMAARSCAFGMELITPAEARLPWAEIDNVRGPIPGPEIQLIVPESTLVRDRTPERQLMAISLKAPFRFVVRFRAHGGTKIDLETFTAKYIKNPFVDLTARMRPYLTEVGIAIPEAGVPPGNHLIRIQVRDNAGRLGTAFVELQVQP
jgi:hypothetical protein